MKSASPRNIPLVIALAVLVPSVGVAPTAGNRLLADDPSFAPTRGVVVLRNGQVIEGSVVREGDRYVIGLDQGDEVRLPVNGVEMVCRSLRHAYLVRKSRLPPDNADRRLDLAQWCLRHGLRSYAAEQILEAMAIDAKNPRVEILERRLASLAVLDVPSDRPGDRGPHRRPTDKGAADPDQTTDEKDVNASEPSDRILSPEELERRVAGLPPVVVERFTTTIQPFLINRCGNSTCHGVRARSDYRLIRPLSGASPSRRITQRNLVATLAQVEPTAPDESPLIKVFEGHFDLERVTPGNLDAWQFERIRRWVETVSAPSRDERDSGPPDLRLATVRPSSLGRAEAEVGTGVPAGAVTGSRRRQLDGQRVDSVDPLDPEVFNRRHFSGPRRD